ncbi:MAG: cytochrome C [Nitrospinae bacterium]|nr:cytochrome C [Nitrospinota bacterium]
MLPEQHDILFSFLTIVFTVFSVIVFINVVQQCKARKDASKAWPVIFGAFILANALFTRHMFTLVQQDQMSFFKWQALTVFVLLLTWGMFFKSENIEKQSPTMIRGMFFWMMVSLPLAGYANWLPQQRSDPPPKAAAITGEMTMEQYTEMGRVIVFGAQQVAGQKAIGKGQCPLCHTFDPGDNMGRCPNLFGVEERSHNRVKEDRYKNQPIKVGETDPASGVKKGATSGEEYLRESLQCPSCYVVEGFGGAGDTKSPMPVIVKPPISLDPVELNAVIAWLQSKETPGDFAKVTVPLPSASDAAAQPKKEAASEGEKPVFVTGSEPVDQMINTLGCPLCHTIPGVEGAVGELGPKLFEKVNAPKRIKDPRYKGKATNTKEYIRESILTPGVYIVKNDETGELYPDGVMPQDFKNKLSIEALDKLVDFISQTEPPPAG